MNTFNIKCYYCGKEFETDTEKTIETCPCCNKELNISRASKYYKSLQSVNQETNKTLAGEFYAKLDLLVEQAIFYINNSDYENATKVLNEALEISTIDARVYMCFVKVKTKNYTDYQDKTHFKDLQKAIKYADFNQKAKIKEEYSYYYVKCNTTKEEMINITSQEVLVKKQKAETLLKDGIPKHLGLEKTIKTKLILLILFSIIGVIMLGVSMIFNKEIVGVVLSYVSIALIFIGICLLLNYSSSKTKINLYNPVLDLFDLFETLNLDLYSQNELLSTMIKFAISYTNNETTINVEKHLKNIVKVLNDTNEESVFEFIQNYKILTKLKNELDLEQ